MMRNNSVIIKGLSIFLICVFVLSFAGCAKTQKPYNLMDDVTPSGELIGIELPSDPNFLIADFSLRLFKAAETQGENTLLSPISVMYALSLTVNGAENQTLEQMQNVLEMDRDTLNGYLHSYMSNLPNSQKNKVTLANSIWFTDDEDFKINQDFLQTNADYYSADIFKVPFNPQTVNDINGWISEKTDKMIPKMLDSVPEDALMYLINALAFEAEWMEPYFTKDVKKEDFTNADGSKTKADFLCGDVEYYIEDEKAVGFMKKYIGGKYAFVALLPDEDVSLSQYVQSLSGIKLDSLLKGKSYQTVKTKIPKFETEFNTDLSSVLKNMGMTDAFDFIKADFSGIGSCGGQNIYISRVLHNTTITVTEKGTKAGAATVVELKDGASMEDTEPKEIYLDRPFVYMIVDTQNNIPLFIGTLNNMK